MLIAELDTCLDCIDAFTYVENRLDTHYDKYRMLKLVSLALNLRISTVLQEQCECSMHTSEDYVHPFPSSENLPQSLSQRDGCIKVFNSLQHLRTELQPFVESWTEICNMFEHQDLDGQRLFSNIIYKNCNPYIETNVLDWQVGFTFPYKGKSAFQKEDCFIQFAKQKMCARDETLRRLRQGELDPISGEDVEGVNFLFEEYETSCVVDWEAMNFLMEIGVNRLAVFEMMEDGLRKLKIVKSPSSIRVTPLSFNWILDL